MPCPRASSRPSSTATSDHPGKRSGAAFPGGDGTRSARAQAPQTVIRHWHRQSRHRSVRTGAANGCRRHHEAAPVVPHADGTRLRDGYRTHRPGCVMDPFIATPAMARVVSSGWPCALHAGACRPYGAQAPAPVRPPPIHGPFPLWPVPCPGIFCAGGSFVVQCESDPDRALAPPLPALSPGSRNGAMRNGLHATSACTDMVLPDHPPPAGTFGPWPSRPAVQPSGFLSRHAAQCLHPSRLRKGAGDLHGLPHARNAGSHHVRQPRPELPHRFHPSRRPACIARRADDPQTGHHRTPVIQSPFLPRFCTTGAGPWCRSDQPSSSVLCTCPS